MNAELSLEFTQGFRWLNEVKSPVVDPFKELCNRFRKLFKRVFKKI